MRRALKIGGILVAVAVLVGVLLFARALRYGFSAHDEPTKIEASIARRMRRWSVPADLCKVTNPVPLTPEVLAEARAHFADHCASCHGNDGKGQTPMGRRLYPKAPDMAAARTQSLSDGELFATIENGIRLSGMPGWGEGTAESAHGSWTLVHLIRRLPKITAEEIAQMERMNPVSPREMEERQSEEKFLEGADEKTGAHAMHAK